MNRRVNITEMLQWFAAQTQMAVEPGPEFWSTLMELEEKGLIRIIDGDTVELLMDTA